MRKYGFWIGLVVLLALVWLGYLLFAQPDQRLRGSVIEPVLPAPEFTLPSTQGGDFTLSEQSGKVVLLFFGYTFCPDVCPATLAEMRRVYEDLGDQADNVRFVFITVDPQRDDLAKMKQHVEYFNPNFVGLSAEETELQPVWDAYGVYRAISQPAADKAYLVDHTARLYLIDPAGGLRVTYAFGTPPEDIVHDLRLILKEADK